MTEDKNQKTTGTAVATTHNQNKLTPISGEVMNVSDADQEVLIEPQKLLVKKGGNVVIGTLNVFITPAKKRYHQFYHPQKNKKWYWHVIIDLLLALAVISLVAFNVYLWQKADLLSNIDITISTEPKEISSGSDVTYVINYHNKSRAQLSDGQLTVNLPANFIKKEISPRDVFSDHTNTFSLGNIDGGANGQLKISGTVWGSVGSTQKIKANLNFASPASSSATAPGRLRDQKSVAYSYNISRSLVSLDLTAPNEVSNNHAFDGNLKYSNLSDNQLAKIIIKIEGLDKDFSILSSSLADQNSFWTIEKIAPQSSGQINFSGKFFTPENVTSRPIKLNLYVELASGERLLQQTLEKNTSIIHSKFLLQLSSDIKNITPGQTMDYVLHYENKETSTLKNIRISAHLSGDFIYNNDSQIFWSANNFPALASVDPGRSGDIKFKITAKKSVKQTQATQKNFIVESWAEGSYNTSLNPNDTIFSLSEKNIQKINTTLNIQTFARYYSPEQEQLGVGPVPPVVGQKTKYWIFLSPDNSYNDLKDITLTASLAKNVSWTMKTTATSDNDVQYNPNNNQITWIIKTLPAASSFFPPVGTGFEVQLIPASDQAGAVANLLENIKMSATDAFTSDQITTSAKDVTTKLIFDRWEKSSGIIKKQ
ncbi:MAG: hypothetical protein WC516_01925 [Patescibacteria group bacterium]